MWDTITGISDKGDDDDSVSNHSMENISKAEMDSDEEEVSSDHVDDNNIEEPYANGTHLQIGSCLSSC